MLVNHKGDLDPSMPNNIKLFDSLVSHKGYGKLNVMPEVIVHLEFLG